MSSTEFIDDFVFYTSQEGLYHHFTLLGIEPKCQKAIKRTFPGFLPTQIEFDYFFFLMKSNARRGAPE